MTKKIILMLSVVLFGIQSMAYSQTDTIRNRYKHYYYSAWYDSCYAAGNLVSTPANNYHWESNVIEARYQYTEDTLEIIGIAVGVRYADFEDTTRVPEYVLLVEGWSDSMQYAIIDSARWDTATPKIMELDYRLAHHLGYDEFGESLCDTVEYKYYINICEAYFKSPITVYDSFYLGMTSLNNIETFGTDLTPYLDDYGYAHQATVYSGCISVNRCRHYSPDIGSSDYGATWRRRENGPYYPEYSWNNVETYYFIFPIIRVYDTFAVVGLSADSLQGYVEGSGSYIEERPATLTAVPHEGYKFVMWNDSVTTNPRTFTVTADTTFTAYFAPLEEYSVEVYVDDLKRGTVQGSGVYYEQSEVTISAQANDGYYFQHWNDSVAANPRTIVLTQDTTFTAHFGVSNDSTVGISAAEANTNLFTLSPNPTTKNLQITLHQTGRYTMEIYSAKGVMLKQEAIGNAATVDVSALVPGTYVVKIYNESISGIRTFVKQ